MTKFYSMVFTSFFGLACFGNDGSNSTTGVSTEPEYNPQRLCVGPPSVSSIEQRWFIKPDLGEDATLKVYMTLQAGTLTLDLGMQAEGRNCRAVLAYDYRLIDGQRIDTSNPRVISQSPECGSEGTPSFESMDSRYSFLGPCLRLVLQDGERMIFVPAN